MMPRYKPCMTTATPLGCPFKLSMICWIIKGQASATGKNVGDDFRERKLTLPVIKAVALADAEERAFWQRTIEKGVRRTAIWSMP